jgi:hypothetical protein
MASEVHEPLKMARDYRRGAGLDVTERSPADEIGLCGQLGKGE